MGSGSAPQTRLDAVLTIAYDCVRVVSSALMHQCLKRRRHSGRYSTQGTCQPGTESQQQHTARNNHIKGCVQVPQILAPRGFCYTHVYLCMPNMLAKSQQLSVRSCQTCRRQTLFAQCHSSLTATMRLILLITLKRGSSIMQKCEADAQQHTTL